MNEKACHPRPVGISDKQRTEHQWQVKASESRELSADPGLSSGAALEPPGLLGLNYGRQTPVVTMLAHVVYGVALGLLLDPS